MKELKAKDVMEREVVSIPFDMSLSKVRDVFLHKRITGAPVVTEDGELLGVLSQTDIVRYAFQRPSGDFPKDDLFLGLTDWGASEKNFSKVQERLDKAKACDVMDTNIFSVSAEDSVSNIAQMMRRHRVHRVIVREGNKAIGVVSSMDMMKLLES